MYLLAGIILNYQYLEIIERFYAISKSEIMGLKQAIMDIKGEISGFEPEIALALGSGLGDFAEEKITITASIPYEKITGFPKPTVSGHKGNLVFGEVSGRRIVCMQGRSHYYEGFSMAEITFPVRVMRSLGASTFLLTNASGGINESYRAGDFMVIADHINFMGYNPLIAYARQPGELRFPDMTHTYDSELRKLALALGEQQKLKMHEGVYLATTGPSFETPAEIRAFRTMGADAVGMSTVPEAIVARQQGMRLLGISFISNQAAGLTGNMLTEDEVFETANKIRQPFMDYVEKLIAGL